MKFIKIMLLIFLLGIEVFATEDETVYLCPPYALKSVELVDKNGKRTTPDVGEFKKGIKKVERYSLKTNWYGKPQYLKWYKKKTELRS